MSDTVITSLQRHPLSESEARILGIVLRSRGTTQGEIVATSNLSQQSVSRLVGDLVDRQALMLGSRRTNGRRGQPSVEIRINPQHAYSLGIALMTDALSIVLMDFAGNVVGNRHFAMPTMNRKAVFARVHEARDHFLAAVPSARERLVGAG